MTTPRQRDVSTRRVLLIRTAPSVVEPEGRAIRFSGPGFQGLRTPGSAPWIDGHPTPGPFATVSSDREIGRLTDAFWSPENGGVLGTLTMFPPGVTSAADRHRGLIGPEDPSQRSDRLSIRYVPIGEDAELRAEDGALDVLRWGISHVASVGEPADVRAGDELGATDGYDLEVEVHWVDLDQEVIMPDDTQKLTELASSLPGLISEGIAAGFQRQDELRRQAEAEAAAQLAQEQLARREAELAERERLLHEQAEQAEADRKAEEERAAAEADEPTEPSEEEKQAEADAAEQEANELAMDKMAEIAASQSELYDPAELARLGMDRAQGLIKTPTEFREKLESIHINPKPIAPGLSNEGEYSVARAVAALTGHGLDSAPIEKARSDELLRQATVGFSRDDRMPGLAIPLSELRAQRIDVPDRYSLASRQDTGAVAAQNVHEVVIDQLVEMYRGDLPDPANVLPYMTMAPSGPGDPRFVAVDTPNPAHVNEPGVVSGNVSAGYVETGDTSTTEVTFSPNLLVCYTSVTRLTQMQSPALEPMIMSILMDKMDEVRNESIIEAIMTGTDTTRNLDHMTDSAEITAAITTAEAMHVATRTSFRSEAVPGSNRIAVLRTGMVDELLNIAEPAAVGRLMMNGRESIDGVPIIRTEYGERRQGFIGPMGFTRMKEWDGAVYVSSRYEAGIMYMLLELFWNWTMLDQPHSEQFYHFLDAS